MQPSILRGTIGFVLGAVIAAVVYVIIRLLVGQPLAGAEASAIVFGGFGGAAGWLWGVGSWSPGAAAHEGPVAVYREKQTQKAGPNFLLRAIRAIGEFFKWALPQILPNLRSLLIALGICVGLVAAIMFIAANPIVPLARRTTYNAAASASAITSDKLIIFLIIAVVILGGLATLAFVLAMLMRSLNRQVEVAKRMPSSELPAESPIKKTGEFIEKLIQFFVRWLADIFDGLRRSVTR